MQPESSIPKDDADQGKNNLEMRRQGKWVWVDKKNEENSNGPDLQNVVARLNTLENRLEAISSAAQNECAEIKPPHEQQAQDASKKVVRMVLIDGQRHHALTQAELAKEMGAAKAIGVKNEAGAFITSVAGMRDGQAYQWVYMNTRWDDNLQGVVMFVLAMFALGIGLLAGSAGRGRC